MESVRPRGDIIAIFLLVIITSLFYYFWVLNSQSDNYNKLHQRTADNQNWTNQIEKVQRRNIKIKSSVKIDAPIIKQYPELPRGCEVTSLAMMLQYKGIDVGKIELANKVMKDQTPLIKVNSQINWGNPNDGFIGDMYSISKPGYGVYHKPIYKLAEEYLPGKIIDISGSKFEKLKVFLSQNNPVWVITNTTYKKLPKTAFQKWNTPSGIVEITYKEHSVLITGYDEKYVYFNDPLSGEKNKSVPIIEFIEAWNQMGRQAITFRN